MQTSGVLMIGTVRIDPNQPVLSIVKVPPEGHRVEACSIGSGGRSWIVRLMPLIDSRSGPWITGTMRPFSTAIAIPTLMRRLRADRHPCNER